jgi:glutamine amidotransferase
MKTIGVLHYGIGNVASIHNALKKVGVNSIAVKNQEDLEIVSGIILPGVGKFDAAMQKLSESGFIGPLSEHVLEKRLPILGICLGMQMMGTGSEEGDRDGLKWLHFTSQKLASDADQSLKVPHMGWSSIIGDEKHPILVGIGPKPRFYFAHSYAVRKIDQNKSIATSKFGDSDFVSIINHENIFGVQFHPEKSHAFGLSLLKNFSHIAMSFNNNPEFTP